jgi:DNA-binding LacI/PurR family transcriptional regulator
VEQVIAVASPHFGSGYGAVMTALLRKLVRPGQRVAECLTVAVGTGQPCPEALLDLLKEPTPPAAVIGIATRPAPDVVAAFRAKAVPVVLIDEEAPGATMVACDNRIGGSLAGKRLLRTPRRRLAVVCGRRGVAGGHNAVTRVKGFEEALSAAGVPLHPGNVIEVVDYSRKDGVAAMNDLLSRSPAVDAVFCAAGDLCAMGMLSVAQERRVEIPEQLAIVGFDDHPMSGLCTPPLTTVRQPLEKIAAQAYRLATELGPVIHAKPQTVLFEPELVERRSA